MLKFNAPYYLLLLILLIIPAWRIIQSRSSGEILFGSILCLPKTKLTWRILLARMLPAAYILALVLIVVALAKPESTVSTKQQKVDAIAIEMVLDRSGSMEKVDSGNTSRLDIAKESFISFIELRENDLIGLLTFSGYTTTKAPLTTNHDILLQLIKTVSTEKTMNSMPHNINKQETLTAIGDAITTACARLRNAKPTSKIIILITDGISNAGIIEPLKAAQIAKRLNIKVYPINIGVTTDNSNQQTILLKEIAEITDGKIFNTTNQKELTDILAEINLLAKTEIETTYISETTNFSTIFIVTALFLIIISATINISIRRRLI